MALNYDSFRVIDLDARGDLAAAGIEHAEANRAIFGSLGPDFMANLRERAVSPFSGKLVPVVEHFGIDSDPWMHSALFRDDERPFIVICQGMTSAGQLGAVLLPQERLLLENRSSWYHREVYGDRIHRNLPRILNFFDARHPHSPDPKQPPLLMACIGNKRVGDFFMQLLWLSKLMAGRDRGSPPQIDQLLVNKASEFCDVASIFPELADRTHRLQSIAHIEYHARHYRGPLVSDVWRLSDAATRRELMERIDRAGATGWITPDVQAGLAELEDTQLRVWLSFDREKRVCRDQEEGLALVLRELANRALGPKEAVGVIVNGLTATVDGHIPSRLRDVQASDAAAAASFAKRIGRPVKLVSMSGMHLGEKISLARNVDLVLAPIGSASIIPSLFLEKPGVVYGYNVSGYVAFAGRQTIILDQKFISKVTDLHGAVTRDTDDHVSYAVDWHALSACIASNFAIGRASDGRIAMNLQGR